jgi:flavin-binding protein dodecin
MRHPDGMLLVGAGPPRSRGGVWGVVSGRNPTRWKEVEMADSVYRVTEIIGVSSESWEAAARNAIETAAKTVRDLRVAEVVRQDVTIENGRVTAYRVRLDVSFKYDTGD